MTTTICHWNIRGFRQNYFHLRTLLSDSQAVVMCLQETKMPDVVPSPPRGFTMYHTAGSAPFQGGVATLVRTNVGHAVLPLVTDLQAVAVRCQLDRLYTICNIYLPPSDRVSLRELGDLVDQLPSPFILVGDFNARHGLWGDVVTSSRGRIVEALLSGYSCSILNDGKPTHFHVQTDSFTPIDLSIVSSDVAPTFSWFVSEDLYNSDHFPVLLALNNLSCRYATPRFVFDKADWPLFKALATCEESIDSFATVDDAEQHLLSKIMCSATAAIPKTGAVSKTKRVPWWNRELEVAVRQKKEATRRYYRTRLVIDKIEYKRCTARVKYLVKTSQLQSWKRYVCTLTERTPMSKVWQRVGKILGRRSGMRRPVLETPDGLVSDTMAVANAFGRALGDVCRGSQDDVFLRHKTRAESSPIVFPEDNCEDYNQPFTLDELSHALKISANTAPGEDGLCLVMLRHLPDISKSFLLALYNRVWVESTLPSSWTVSVVLPIHKKDTTGKHPLHYRPIALTSTLCKLMERMVNIRLVWHLESDNVLHPNQYGFRRCRSSVDALARLDSYIKVAFARREHVVAVFFDLHKAYDKTWRHHILAQLSAGGFRGHLPRFIQRFLSDRVLKVRIGSTLSAAFPQLEGVPQGSVLSCTLFALAINGLPSCIPPTVESSLYVDDFAIFTRSANLRSATRRIQLAVNAARNWTTTNGFLFSVEKTVSMHFTRNRGLFPAPSLFLGPRMIRHANETKFLGLTLDGRLSYLPHLRSLRQRCLKAVDLLKCLSRLSWGADRTTLLRVYRALIRSKLDYACQIYSSASGTSLRMLDTIHHLALRLCTGSFRTSPIPSLYVDSGEPSLSFRRDKLSLQLYVRLLGLPSSPSGLIVSDNSTDHYFSVNPRRSTTLGFRARTLLRSLSIDEPAVMDSLSYISPPYASGIYPLCPGIIKTSKSDIPADIMRGLFTDHSAFHSEQLAVYTDGSKSENGVGFSVILPQAVKSKRLPDAASIYSAELHAVLFALAYFTRIGRDSFVIYSDSRSALQSICDPFSFHPIVQQIHAWLRMLDHRQKAVNFCWVPSHVGVPGNERADQAAKDVIVSTPIAPARALPYRDYYPYFHSCLRERWQESWTNTFGNKLRSIKATIASWHTSCRADRRQETVLARLRIGHTRLTHGHLLSGSPPPYCDDCLVPLTVAHILTECPTFSEHREEQFGADGIVIPVSLAFMLRDFEPSISKLFNFLASTGQMPSI